MYAHKRVRQYGDEEVAVMKWLDSRHREYKAFMDMVRNVIIVVGKAEAQARKHNQSVKDAVQGYSDDTHTQQGAW